MAEETPDIDYSKISITAKLVAYFRQFSDIAFAQDVASSINAEAALLEIASQVKYDDESADHRRILSEQGKIYAPLLEARYKSIVQVILRTGIKQVLELASGFSLRGLAMSQTSGIAYVESDLPGVNEEKNKLIASLRSKYRLGNSGNHHVVTANALKRADLEAATAALRQDEPLVIVNEGLIPYLSAEEQATLAGNVRWLLSQFAGGAWITPDFTTRQLANDVPDYIKRFRDAISKITARQLQEAAFACEEAIEEFVARHGFSGTWSFQLDEVTNLVSQERLGLSDQVTKRLKPHMRIWLLLPQ